MLAVCGLNVFGLSETQPNWSTSSELQSSTAHVRLMKLSLKRLNYMNAFFILPFTYLYVSCVHVLMFQYVHYTGACKYILPFSYARNYYTNVLLSILQGLFNYVHNM